MTAERSGIVVFRADGSESILHTPGKSPEILDELEDRLACSAENVFVHAGRFVQVSISPPKMPYCAWRPNGALTNHPLDSAYLAVILTKVVRHDKYNARTKEPKPCNCPRHVADELLSKGYWPAMHHLSGFAESPTVTPGNELIDMDGYDPHSGLFVAMGDLPGYSSPAKKPTMKDARQAFDYLSELIGTFPFVADEDRVGAVAAIITALVRRVLPAAPLFAYTAPTAGTGKTLVANTAAVIATGREAAVLSLGHDDAEAEKRLAGVFMAGDAVVNIDNVEGHLGGVVLCQACTQPTLRIRPLGGSNVIDVPTNSLLMATGNNLSIVGDLKRRVVLVRLDAATERPEQRSFERNHLENVLAWRGKAISAALKIVRAYLGAGAPKIDGHTPFGSFETWDRMVRCPLLWLGLPDPLRPAEALRDQDPDMDAMRLLFAAWMSAFGSDPKSAADVVATGMRASDLVMPSTSGELYDALQLVCSEKPNTRRLGGWLRAHRDRIIDGMQLRQVGRDGHLKVMKWSITKV